LEVEKIEEYPYEKSFAEAKSDPAFVLHTSGSTGNPHSPEFVSFTKNYRYTKAFDFHQRIHLSNHHSIFTSATGRLR
jgi:acyl-coenzyme A synthetase/AMP-(fatty) acid ligase